MSEYVPSEAEMRMIAKSLLPGATDAEALAAYERFLANVRAEAIEQFVDGFGMRCTAPPAWLCEVRGAGRDLAGAIRSTGNKEAQK